MRVEILVPQIGEAVAELILVAWHKHVGDKIEKGDLLFEIDSDKAIVEVDAFVDGTLTQIIEPDQSAVMPQQVVAIIETAADISQVESRGYRAGIAASPYAAAAENRGVLIEKSHTTEDEAKTLNDEHRKTAGPKISPKARRLAKQASVDWTSITGSGSNGMILVSDIERAIEAKCGRNP
ncbi:MAG: E3 binding domain-containing protein [Chloroflexota bacterium]|nr:E3 binding domain-containing protein [Chloroflexota bacterium]MDE2949066.1 E3 binding domain-containing protein [Chloroflexota bacterium]